MQKENQLLCSPCTSPNFLGNKYFPTLLCEDVYHCLLLKVGTVQRRNRVASGIPSQRTHPNWSKRQPGATLSPNWSEGQPDTTLMATVGDSVGRDVRRRRENVVEHGLGARRGQGILNGFLQSKNIFYCSARNTYLAKEERYISIHRSYQKCSGVSPPLNYGQFVNLTPVKSYQQGLIMVFRIE